MHHYTVPQIRMANAAHFSLINFVADEIQLTACLLLLCIQHWDVIVENSYIFG
jgi:hypothetical protein